MGLHSSDRNKEAPPVIKLTGKGEEAGMWEKIMVEGKKATSHSWEFREEGGSRNRLGFLKRQGNREKEKNCQTMLDGGGRGGKGVKSFAGDGDGRALM